MTQPEIKAKLNTMHHDAILDLVGECKDPVYLALMELSQQEAVNLLLGRLALERLKYVQASNS